MFLLLFHGPIGILGIARPSINSFRLDYGYSLYLLGLIPIGLSFARFAASKHTVCIWLTETLWLPIAKLIDLFTERIKDSQHPFHHGETPGENLHSIPLLMPQSQISCQSHCSDMVLNTSEAP